MELFGPGFAWRFNVERGKAICSYLPAWQVIAALKKGIGFVDSSWPQVLGIIGDGIGHRPAQCLAIGPGAVNCRQAQVCCATECCKGEVAQSVARVEDVSFLPAGNRV